MTKFALDSQAPNRTYSNVSILIKLCRRNKKNMALIRSSPFHEMESLQRDMNRMFEALASNERGSMRQSFMPLAEMEQTEDAIYLRVEVPGMSADDLDVRVTREAVMISGERKSESKSEKNDMRRSEFRYGSFSRTIPLPIPIDNNQVEGDYQDGILTLELPKLQKQENKVTKVNISSSSDREISQSRSESFSEESDSSAINSNHKNEASSPEGASEVSAKEMLDTHGSSEPSANNVDVESNIGGYGNQDVWDDSPQTT